MTRRVDVLWFAAPDGGFSRFDSIEVALAPTEEGPLLSSTTIAAVGIVFAEISNGYTHDWHPASRRQFVVVLSGRVVIETSDGEVRRFEAGQHFLADDVASVGHRVRIEGGPARVLFVHLAPRSTGAFDALA